MRSRLGKRVSIGLLVSSLLTALAITFALYNNNEHLVLAEEQEHISLFVKNLDENLSQLHELIEGYRGYAISGDTTFLQSYERALNQIPTNQNNLKDYAKRNPDFTAYLDTLISINNQLIRFSSQVVSAKKAGDIGLATKIISTKKGEHLKNEIINRNSILIHSSEQKMKSIEIHRNHLALRSSQMNYLFAIVSIVLIVLVFQMIRKELSRRKAMEDMVNANAESLSEEVRIKTSEVNEILYRITDGFASLDNNWIVTYINKRACEIFHLDSEKIIGKNIWNEFPEGIGGAFEDAYKQAKSEQKAMATEQYYAALNICVRMHIYPSANGLSLFIEDITDRKKSEEALQQSERRFRQLIEEMPEAIYTCDAEGKITMYNKAAERLWGRAPELGKEMWCGSFKLYTKNSQPLLHDNSPMARCIRENQFIVGQEVIVERPDGSKKYVIAHPAPLNDLSGNLTGAVNILIDITERRNAEQIIKKTASELAEAQRLAKCGNWVLEANSGKLTWSDELYNIFGIDKSTVQLNYDYFLNLVDESDREHIDLASVRAQTEGTPFDIEYHIKTGKGEHRIIQELGDAERDENGNIIRLFGTAQDITERKKAELELKKSEQNYRYLFNNNPTIIFIWNPRNLKILEMNQTALNEYGYTHDEFMKMSILDYRPEEDHEKVRFLASQFSSGSINRSKGVWKYFRKDGEILFMEVTSHKIIYNEESAVLALAENISDKLRLEEQLKKSFEDITLLNTHLQNIREKERTEIARDIHDELGQQLTALKMDAAWLNKKIRPVDEAIIKRFTRMIALIDQTVNSVRRIASDLRPGILDTIGLEAALDWLSKDFEKRTGIQCRIQLKHDECYSFEKDLATCVFRVYQESLTNIMRYAKATIVESKMEISNGQITLSVRDNGIGFDVNNLENKNSFGIIGMKERAKVFNGDVFIESEKGKGTILRLRLPFLQTKKTRV